MFSRVICEVIRIYAEHGERTMKKEEFISKLKTLIYRYFSEKYKDSDYIPLVDVVVLWGYSINSYSYVKNNLRRQNIPIYAGESISISDFINATLTRMLPVELI